jgi:hypothetical protein
MKEQTYERHYYDHPVGCCKLLSLGQNEPTAHQYTIDGKNVI